MNTLLMGETGREKMSDTKIQWADKTWNPVTGCTKISAGCQNCYAEKMSMRLKAMGNPKYKNGFAVRCHGDTLDKPDKWQNPKRIFVCSMSDLFHEDVPNLFQRGVFTTIGRNPLHTFMVLTKRPERMKAFIESLVYESGFFDDAWGGYFDQGMFESAILEDHFPNLWLGVTCENQETADERIPILLQTPAAVRFVSFEPLLESMNILSYFGYPDCPECEGVETYEPDMINLPGQTVRCPECNGNGWVVDGEHGIDWVITGCESGPGRRPCKLEWIRDLKDQCVDASAHVFIKQAVINGKVVKMPTIDGQIWDQLPEKENGASKSTR